MLAIPLSLFLVTVFSIGIGYQYGKGESDQMMNDCNTALYKEHEMYRLVMQINDGLKGTLDISAKALIATDIDTLNQLTDELKAKGEEIKATNDLLNQKASSYEEWREQSPYIKRKAE